MKTRSLSDDELQYILTPPRHLLYWLIKDAYTIVAQLEAWDDTSITLKTEYGITSKEDRNDVKIIISE